LSSFDPARSRKIALDAARRLASLVDADGKFLYRYDAATGARSDEYNLTRHVCAIWAAAILARRSNLPELLDPLNRAARWLIDRHVRRAANIGLPVIVEETGVELGCMAMGLLSLLELHRAKPDEEFLGLATAFGRYILGQTSADGEFHHRRLLPSGQASDHFSRYATAQSVLALAELYAETRERSFLDPALACESLLAKKDFGVREHGHWVLYAIEALEAVAPQAEHRAHGRRIAGAIQVYPLYRNSGKSNPLACNSEALAAYLRLLRGQPPQDGTEDSPGETLVRATLEENLGLLAEYRLPDGGFIEGEGLPVVQIDHIQHAMAAFFGHALLDDPRGSRG
jgi:hypothetical protein